MHPDRRASFPAPSGRCRRFPRNPRVALSIGPRLRKPGSVSVLPRLESVVRFHSSFPHVTVYHGVIKCVVTKVSKRPHDSALEGCPGGSRRSSDGRVVDGRVVPPATPVSSLLSVAPLRGRSGPARGPLRSRLPAVAGRATLCQALARVTREDAVEHSSTSPPSQAQEDAAHPYGGLPSVGLPLAVRHLRGLTGSATLRLAPLGCLARLTGRFALRSLNPRLPHYVRPPRAPPRRPSRPAAAPRRRTRRP